MSSAQAFKRTIGAGEIYEDGDRAGRALLVYMPTIKNVVDAMNMAQLNLVSPEYIGSSAHAAFGVSASHKFYQLEAYADGFSILAFSGAHDAQKPDTQFDLYYDALGRFHCMTNTAAAAQTPKQWHQVDTVEGVFGAIQDWVRTSCTDDGMRFSIARAIAYILAKPDREADKARRHGFDA